MIPTPNNCKLLMRYVGVFLLFCFLLKPMAGWTEEGEIGKTSSSKTEAVTQEQAAPEKNLVDFLSYFTDLSKQFVELESQIDESNILSRFENDLSEISGQMQQLSGQVDTISTNVELNYDRFEIITTKAYKLGYQIRKANTPLFEIIENLSRLNTEWAQKRELLDDWVKIAEKEISFKLVKNDILTLQKKIDFALKLISERMKPALTAQKKSFDLEIKIHSLTRDIEKLTQHYQKRSVEKTVSLFSSGFYSQLNKELLVTIWENAGAAAVSQRQLFTAQRKAIMVLCLAIFIIAIFNRRSKKWVKASSDWYPFTERPLASAVFLCIAVLVFVDFFNEDVIQVFKGWEGTRRIIMLSAIVRLSGALLERTWKKRFFFLVTLSMMVIEFFKLTNLPQPVFYLCNLFIGTLILIFCLWQNFRLSRQDISLVELLGLRSGSFILFSVLVLAMTVGQEFTQYLLISLLNILIFAFILWILTRAAKSLLELLLLTIPMPVAQRNSSVIVSQLTPIIIIFYAYVIFILLLQFLGFYPTKEAAMKSLASFSLAAGSWVISPGTLLSAGITVYIVFLFSKTIQGLLLQEVLPRYNAAKGVQFSIIRLVNYAILTFGFFLVLHVLGFKMQSLTIFGGALGIGIGFGLQTIVVNLASGLILLFERPVKVGDTIQVNNEYGEIKNLGLRATVVETFDNAEIVIPNSDLITGPVTNWTLAERRSRVKVPVGVAYGTDITKVMEILMNCAEDSPMVLSNPKPNALFLCFGESSLDFELRVWIPEFNDRLTVLSELNQQINDEFKLAGIEIPFPQRDLHLRSTNS